MQCETEITLINCSYKFIITIAIYYIDYSCVCPIESSCLDVNPSLYEICPSFTDVLIKAIHDTNRKYDFISVKILEIITNLTESSMDSVRWHVRPVCERSLMLPYLGTQGSVVRDAYVRKRVSERTSCKTLTSVWPPILHHQVTASIPRWDSSHQSRVYKFSIEPYDSSNFSSLMNRSPFLESRLTFITTTLFLSL